MKTLGISREQRLERSGARAVVLLPGGRELEREMIPLLKDRASDCSSGARRGRISYWKIYAGQRRRGRAPGEVRFPAGSTKKKGFAILDVLSRIATERSVQRRPNRSAWILAQDSVTSAIIGAPDLRSSRTT